MELWGKTDILRRLEGPKFKIEVQNGTSEGCFGGKIILKTFWRHPPPFWPKFHIKHLYFQIKSTKFIEIHILIGNPVVVVSPGNCNKSK